MSLSKLTKGKDSLDILLGSQRVSFSKACIGFDPIQKKGFYKNLFLQKPTLACHYCNKVGHTSPTCPLKRTNLKTKKMVKQVWVPKSKVNEFKRTHVFQRTNVVKENTTHASTSSSNDKNINHHVFAPSYKYRYPRSNVFPNFKGPKMWVPKSVH